MREAARITSMWAGTRREISVKTTQGKGNRGETYNTKRGVDKKKEVEKKTKNQREGFGSFPFERQKNDGEISPQHRHGVKSQKKGQGEGRRAKRYAEKEGTWLAKQKKVALRKVIKRGEVL